MIHGCCIVSCVSFEWNLVFYSMNYTVGGVGSTVGRGGCVSCVFELEIIKHETPFFFD